MPLLPQTTQKRQQLLIYMLVVVIVATAVVLYFGFFSAPTLPEEGAGVAGISADVVKIGAVVERIRTLILVLDDPSFKNLKVHGDLPVKPDRTGRLNPFMPY